MTRALNLMQPRVMASADAGRGATPYLWLLVGASAIVTLQSVVAPDAVPATLSVALGVLLLFAFALVHGAVAYRPAGIPVFTAVALLVSNIFENQSILMGFPLSHYAYSDALGPKLLLVPVLIGPACAATTGAVWRVRGIYAVTGLVEFFTMGTFVMLGSMALLAGRTTSRQRGLDTRRTTEWDVAE